MTSTIDNNGNSNNKNNNNNINTDPNTKTMVPQIGSSNAKCQLLSNIAVDILHLLTETTSTSNRGNVVISPLLLDAGLALIYLGSDGSTADQLRHTLQLGRFSNNIRMANYYAEQLQTAITDPDTSIKLCQSLVLDESQPTADEFQQIAQKYFQTSTKHLDSKNVNNLKDYLASMLSQITTASLTSTPEVLERNSVFLLMASNFQSKWFLPFSAYRSGVYEFTAVSPIGEPKSVAVPMVFDDDMFVKFGEFKELDARAIELPFEHQDDLVMLVVLPNKRDGLPKLMESMRSTNCDKLLDRMQMESVQVLLPKFKIDFECSLRQHLEKLRLDLMFSKEANFKNMLKNDAQKDALRVVDVLHKVHIELNESGSEVPKVSANNKPIVISNSIDSKKKFFRADHPFYFAILNRDVTYFIGQISSF